MASKTGLEQSSAEPIGAQEAGVLLSEFSNSGPLALAVSGGPDSMALMTLMGDCLDRTGTVPGPVAVLSVDHGLRPGSDREAAGVGVWARRFGFEHAVLTWRGQKPRRGVQAAARQARYDLMSRWCVERGIDTLLLAHTLDDLAETFLLRLARGSGVDGLAAMTDGTMWNGIALRRPLLDVRRDRLIATLRERGVTWLLDPSNEDDRFARARMRKLLPALTREGLTVRRIADTARRMRRARHALERSAVELSRRAVTLFDTGHCRINTAELVEAPDELMLRVLARTVMALGGNPYPPRLVRLERLATWLADGNNAGCTLGGCRFERRGSVVICYRERGRCRENALVLKSGETAVWDGRFHVSATTSARARYDVRALEAEGWRRVCSVMPRRPVLPARIGHGLVSFWAGEQLVAVPHLGFQDRGQAETESFSARFCNAGLLGFSDTALTHLE